MIGKDPTPAQLETAAAIDTVCRQHGFLYLNNFGVTAEDARLAFDKSKELFGLSEAEKQGLRRYDPATNTGFSGYATESLNKIRPPDMKEAFNVRAKEHYKNDYSGAPAGFGDMAEAFWDKLNEANRRLSIALAVALKLPSKDLRFFSKACEKTDLCTLRFLHCPPCDFDPGSATGDTDKVALRLGEHTDFGMVTILFHDSAGQCHLWKRWCRSWRRSCR